MRRVNLAIYLMTIGARKKAFRNLMSVARCLADEILNASKDKKTSYAIKSKDTMENTAASHR